LADDHPTEANRGDKMREEGTQLPSQAQRDPQLAPAQGESGGLVSETTREESSIPPQIEHQIGYALDELGAQNGHHTFEDICRYFAQSRIASNILYPTGPVASGGDQGRDIETFQTFLEKELGPHGAFLGLVSDELIVFCATIQQANIDSKILSDVETIVSAGRQPAAIYAFYTGHLVVSKRHALENNVAEIFGGTFEVIDRGTLAAQLAAPDLFWIAERYLNLPAYLRPPRPAEDASLPEWYLSDRDRWRERGSPQPNLADILDLKDGLRHATRVADARQDLPFWLNLARRTATDQAPQNVRHRARYEVAWATVQAQNDARPADELVRSLVEDVIAGEHFEPAAVEDATVLLTVWGNALRAGRTDLAAAELRQWNDALRTRLRTEIAAELRPTRRAGLLDCLGHLALQMDPLHMDVPAEMRDLPDVLEMIDESGELRPVQVTPEGWPHPIDLAETMAAWTELAGLLASAPLFPVTRFSWRLTFMTPILADEPGWRELVDAVDDAVQEASGAAAVAAIARDRGIALYSAGRFRTALHEMHTAKVKWWTGDTLRESLLSMLVIAECYRSLLLPQAATQHALAVAYAAHSDKEEVLDLVPTGLLLASEIAYESGAWFGALELAETGLAAQAHYVDIDMNPAAAAQFQRTVATVGWCLLAAREALPKFVPYVEQIARRVDILDGLTEITANSPLGDSDAVLRLIDEQLLGRALSDAGDTRTIRFKALGVDWTITSSNRFGDVRAAERMAAALQVVRVELYEDDLCLLPTCIRVRVEASTGALPLDGRVRWRSSNRDRDWHVRLTGYDGSALDAEAVSRELLFAITQILADASLVPQDLFLSAVESAYRRGLAYKLSSVRVYDELALPREVYTLAPRALVHPPADPAGFRAQEHLQLAWRSDAGPTYTAEESLRMAEERYVGSFELIPKTLARLGADVTFADHVRTLRKAGWLDWHIVQAVVNAALNDRVRREGIDTFDLDVVTRRTRELYALGDFEEDPQHPLELTASSLDLYRLGAIPVVLNRWRLGLHQRAPDFPAIDTFLRVRYGYWTDDVEHADPFPMATAESGTA
jgi:hypothetical protein